MNCLLWHEEDTLELKLSLNAEVLDSKVVLPVVGQGLVEGCVLILSDLLRVAHPDGFLLVHKRPLMADLLDLQAQQQF